MKMACAEQQDEDCATRVQNILAQDPSTMTHCFWDGLLNLAKGDAAKAVREFEYLSSIYHGRSASPIPARPRLSALRQRRQARSNSRNAL